MLFSYAASFAGTAEDNLLAASLARLDVKGVEIALRKGANAKVTLKHPDAPTIQKYPVQLALSGLLEREDEKAPQKVERMLRLVLAKGARPTGDPDELFLPISYGHTAILKLLLDNGANPHARIDGYLPIELAIKYGQDQLLPLLASRSAPKVADADAAQLRLVRAASLQDKAAMQLAFSAGAQVNHADTAGRYAIVELLAMPLIDPSGYEVLKWLLVEKNADVRVIQIGKKSTSAIHRVIEMNSFRREDFASTAQIVETLLERGSDVSAEDYLGRTPLHYAAERGNYTAAEVLLRSSAKVAARDHLKKTPLDLAKSREVISLLRQYGARE